MVASPARLDDQLRRAFGSCQSMFWDDGARARALGVANVREYCTDFLVTNTICANVQRQMGRTASG